MMAKSPPFYAQKWDLSKWRELGFDSQKDAKYWEASSCGILCLKMAMDAILSERSQPPSSAVLFLLRSARG